MRRYFVFIGAALLSLVPTSASAHGLECNQPTIQFNEPIAHNFLTVNLGATGNSWKLSSECPIGTNVATGNGEAACVSSSPGDQEELVLQSLEFYLGCKASAILSFTLAFQDPSELAVLDLEVLPSGNTEWSPLTSWDSSVGTPTLGIPVTVDLSAFAASGFAPTSIRWRFSSNAGNDAFAQLDDISLLCTDAPAADIDLSLSTDIGPLPPGAVRDISVLHRNFGPSASSTLPFTLQWSGATQFLGTTAHGHTPVISSDTLATVFPGLVQGAELDSRLWFRFNQHTEPPSDPTVTFIGATQSDLCDIRLNNNSRQVAVTIDQLSPIPNQLRIAANKVAKMIKTLRRRTTHLRCAKNRQSFRGVHRKILRVTSARTRANLLEMNQPTGDRVGSELLKARRVGRALRSSCEISQLNRLSRRLNRAFLLWQNLGQLPEETT